MQARVEVEILEMLRERDPEGKYNCGKSVTSGLYYWTYWTLWTWILVFEPEGVCSSIVV